MKNIILLLAFFGGFSLVYFKDKLPHRKPCGDPNFDRAIRTATRAVFKTKVAKRYTKTLEKKAFKSIQNVSGLEGDTIKKTLPVIQTLATGRISTNGVKIRWNITENAQFRPNLEYNLRSNEFNGSFQLDWEF